MTPSGRIMLRADWMREQENIAGRKRYEQREQLQQQWRAAALADVADTVPETAEPKICECGKHYTTKPNRHTKGV